MKSCVICLLLCLSVQALGAITDLSSGEERTVSEFVDSIQPGNVILVGESHAEVNQVPVDQLQQIQLIQQLMTKHKNVSVAMEFIPYTSQTEIDLFLNKQLTEEEFLLGVSWGQSPFEAYKFQVLSTKLGEGWTYGINSPAEVTRFIGKNGLGQLPLEFKSTLPPNFQLGSPLYKQRFFEQMSYMAHHGVNLDFYFQSQSVWDDTMAWSISEIMKKDSQQILVVIVGQFHVMYNLGLPNRLKARGVTHVKSMVQMSVYKDVPPQDLSQLINDPIYGPIADYIWK